MISTRIPWKQLTSVVLDILKKHPVGISEHAMLKKLAHLKQFTFFNNPNRHSHALFQSHFILFHVLYQQRDRLWQNKEANLDINPLLIQLLPYQKGENSLKTIDPLHDYYLNLDNVDDTTAEDVQQLLDSFWQRFHNKDERQKALAELGLRDPVDDATIKRTYRKLAMEHHPDRGGNKSKLQNVHTALAVLLK